MKLIAPERLYEILNTDRLRYWEMLQLLKDRRDGQDALEAAFANDNDTCFSIVSHWHMGTDVFFSDYEPAFINEVLRRCPKAKRIFRFWFDLLPGQEAHFRHAHDDFYLSSSPYFAYTGEAPAASIDPHIHVLSGNEIDLLHPIIDLEHGYDVMHEPGIKAFAWFDEGQYKAYLACSPVYEEFWRIRYEYLKEQPLEVVTALFYAYLKTIRERSGIPITYDHLAASQKAGFQLYKTTHCFYGFKGTNY